MSELQSAYTVWKESGLKQGWVAQRMGIRPDQLNHMLRGRREWTPEAREAFAEVVGVPEEEIHFA